MHMLVVRPAFWLDRRSRVTKHEVEKVNGRSPACDTSNLKQLTYFVLEALP